MRKITAAGVGVVFEEIDVTAKPDIRKRMNLNAGGRDTVPQIWIDETHVGGCDDLRTLDRASKLDLMLAR